MTGAWCAQALIHDNPMERRSINANPAPSPSSRKNSDPAKKSHCHLTPVSLFPLIQPSIQLSTIHPSIHPSLPVPTAFAFYSRIKPLSLSFAHFLSPQLPCVTLSHVSLNSFNTYFASNTSRKLPMRRRRATGQAPKTVCVHTNTSSYLNCSAREDIPVKRKKKNSCV